MRTYGIQTIQIHNFLFTLRILLRLRRTRDKEPPCDVAVTSSALFEYREKNWWIYFCRPQTIAGTGIL